MNKVVLITGSSSGIGLATARKFATEGWTVYGTVKSLSEAGVSSLKKLKNTHVLKLDVTKDSDTSNVIENIIKKEGHIDLLINNAGFGFIGPVEDFEIEEVIEQYEVNLFGAIRMIKSIVPDMRRRQSGKIINIGSVNGLVSFPLYGIYSSSKFALGTITEVLRFELAPFGIKVSIVEPGTFTTNFSKNRKHPKQMNSDTSAYKKWAPQFLQELLKSKPPEGMISKLMNPNRVANLIWKIANKKNPKLRYKIGLDTRFFTISRRILPYRIWRWCINLGYKWK